MRNAAERVVEFNRHVTPALRYARFLAADALVIVLYNQRLDAALAPELGDLLARPLPPPVSRLVLDLGRVASMDASALGAIVYAFRTPGAELALANPTERVRQLLAATGLGNVLDVYPTRDSALGQRPGTARWLT